jgi:O-methyltransferase
MNAAEKLKFVIYRTPMANRLMRPKYGYKINPGQLSAMIEFIDGTSGSGAAVVEIGVAQGDSSVFLLEHLRCVRDPRQMLLFDTFSGFTDESIDFEVENRSKKRQSFDVFKYGDESRFIANVQGAGYTNFKTVAGDASRFDWRSIGPIGAVLLDIDLYKPTIDILNAIFPSIVEGGGIVVDDCLAGTPWDGSLQAYEEFILKHDLPFERVGEKGGLIRR